ncbi:hypothetical protein JHK85_021658 [Glycine max]|uniref:Uncharacterized protein n=1 Tax=Glycine max TaxID=3847 RepID=A0A0R0IL29_SOYBN|nr:hypothetical protein JHK85_021658 [Glycine max]KAH1050939.1 hypothetical protein GYH30_021065 [Glycine max]
MDVGSELMPRLHVRQLRKSEELRKFRSLCSLRGLAETASHLFFSCKASKLIWKRWYNLFGHSSVLPQSQKEHFCSKCLCAAGQHQILVKDLAAKKSYDFLG